MNNNEFFELIKDKIVGHISDSDLDGLGCRILAEIFIENKCKKYIPCNTGDRSMVEVPKDFFDNLEVLIFTDITPPSLEYYQNIVDKGIEVIILDHHITGKEILGELKNYIYDVERCGTKLFYDFLTEGKRKSKIISNFAELVDIYDLWKLDHIDRQKSVNLFFIWSGYVKNWSSGIPATDLFNDFIQMQMKKFNMFPDSDFYFTYYEKELIVKAEKKVKDNFTMANKNISIRTDNSGNKYAYTECGSKLSIVSNTLLTAYNDLAYIIIHGTFDEIYNHNPNGKVSLRSNNGFDVRIIAEKHGGGGHQASAGLNLELDKFYSLRKGETHLI